MAVDFDYKFAKQALQIDQTMLSAEIKNQPMQHMNICEAYVHAKSRLADAEMRLDQTKAERRKHWRYVLEKGDPDDDDDDRRRKKNPPLNEIDSYVQSDPMFLREKQKVQDLQQNVDLLSFLRESSAQRSFMFRELVTLEAAGLLGKDNIKPRDPVLALKRRLEVNESGERVELYKKHHEKFLEKQKAKKKKKKHRETL